MLVSVLLLRKAIYNTSKSDEVNMSIRPIVRCKGHLSKTEILKLTKEQEINELGQHELGDIGERITRDVLIPRIQNISRVRRLDLKGVSGVPFDVVATYGAEIWLIETKTGKTRFEGIQATQKERMRIILEILAKKGIAARPILVQIKLSTGQYVVRDFNTEYKKKGLAPTFERIVGRILEYAQDQKSH